MGGSDPLRQRDRVGRRPRRYDVVRTGLEYVPLRRQRDLVARLLEAVVAPGGRLVIGTYNEAAAESSLWRRRIASWGFPIAGRDERPHFHDARLRYRVLWIDA